MDKVWVKKCLLCESYETRKKNGYCNMKDEAVYKNDVCEGYNFWNGFTQLSKDEQYQKVIDMHKVY